MIDKNFMPIELSFREYERAASAGEPFYMSLIRSGSERYTVSFKIIKPTSAETVKYAVKTLRSILYIVGGYKVEVAGSKPLCDALINIFGKNGSRKFDADFMTRVFGDEFKIVRVDKSRIKPTRLQSVKIGGNAKGCRIGFDAGGSDRKTSAVIDGNPVYSEEVVWFPKTNADPAYHKAEITKAFETAKSKLPKIDGIGVSTAGIVVNNKIKIASLFIKVPDEKWKTEVENIYIDCAKSVGENIPLTVANDGDITAIAGAQSINDNGVLGIAMGTSEAAGYFNTDDGLNGWLNELAFVPVDYFDGSAVDEWCGDYGCGVKYFSQDGAIKLAETAGLTLNGTPAEKLKQLQTLLELGDKSAEEVFESVGEYLGHTLLFYSRFYEIKHLLLLGRVMSGKGGDLILKSAKNIIEKNYPDLKNIDIMTPNEKMRRVGQSVTAALL